MAVEMPMCMSKNAKTVMLNLIEKQKPHELLAMTVTDIIPACEEMEELQVALKRETERVRARTAPEPWPQATLTKEDGTEVTGSISGLYKDVFGVPVTEDKVCRITSEGKADCRSISAVENWQSKGYRVEGDGESAPTVKPGMSTGEIDRMFKAWKDQLIKEEKTINIYAPKTVEVKPEVKAKKKK